MPLNPGDMLANHYRIEVEIGRGAYGRVYRARDVKLDRPVAIKELAKGADDLGSSQFADYVRRFEREARIQAGFNHPNIVHVYELIQESPDRLYLVMEYVDGENLRDALARRGPLPVDEAVRITSDILAGLAAVHADPRDIVHRDIKPSNVLLTKAGQAKLADFGLAQVGDESLRSEGGKPHPGTALYMSPEQETTSAYLYPASDLFSVGCVLFEMLTGVPYKRAKKERKGLTELRPDVPPWLSEIVTAALARDPDDRPANTAEIERILAEAKAKVEVEVKIEAGFENQERTSSDGMDTASERDPSSWWHRLLGPSRPAEPVRGALETSPSPTFQRTPASIQVSTVPFRFRSGREVKDVAELVRACAAAPVEALWHLERGLFEPWLRALGRADLEQAASNARQSRERPPVKLEQFLDATGFQHGYRSRTHIPFEWVTIPAGEFFMGSDPAHDRDAQVEEQPQHRVFVAEFRIARLLVTNVQYKHFVDATGHRAPFHWPSGRIPRGKENHPVVSVTWQDAQAFCEQIGVRLLTEAEWERAARGIDGRVYPWGYEQLDTRRCNFGNHIGDTTPVGKYPKGASPFGVLDMAGNVWEWTSSLSGHLAIRPLDTQDERPSLSTQVRAETGLAMGIWQVNSQVEGSAFAYPYNPNDGRESLQTSGNRVLRGGSFRSDSRSMRCAYRSAYIPSCAYDDVGFRVASAVP